MNISEMHIWFRQYAQQMGIQNVRGILPEQIDLCINTAISDTINQTIKENIDLTSNRVIKDNSKLGQINIFRTLYKVKELRFGENLNNANIYPINNNLGLYRCYGFMKDYDESTTDNYIESHRANISTYAKIDPLFLIDLSVNFRHSNTITQIYPVRLIDDIYLADTLHDSILKPRYKSPIAVLYNTELDIYFGEKENRLITTLAPNVLRISYIAKPNKVAYLNDVGGTNVDCNLPEFIHVDILKKAVDLYNTAIRNGVYSAQTKRPNNNYDNRINQNSTDNESYQG